MAKQIIKGDDLMLFNAEGKSIAYATAHTLTLTADAADISTKDHGIWGGTEINKINWEISSENLYTETEFDTLMTSMMTRQPIDVYFGLKNETDPEKTVVNDDYPNWTGKGGSYYGKAYITNLTANANTGENATFSLSLKGTGKITKSTTVPKA